mgnify:CR=1 FL=1
MHTGDNRYDYSNPDRLVRILNEYPDLTVIGAHFGGWSVWDEAVEKLSEYPNFYVDTSSCFCDISIEKATELIERYTPDRVLFGTDYPMWSQADDLAVFFEMGLTEAENRLILSENAKRVFSIR